MLNKLLAIVIIVIIFWILQWAGIINYMWIGIVGFVFIVFGVLFTIMLGDTLEGVYSKMIAVGVIFLIIGVILILVQPGSLI